MFSLSYVQIRSENGSEYTTLLYREMLSFMLQPQIYICAIVKLYNVESVRLNNQSKGNIHGQHMMSDFPSSYLHYAPSPVADLILFPCVMILIRESM